MTSIHEIRRKNSPVDSYNQVKQVIPSKFYLLKNLKHLHIRRWWRVSRNVHIHFSAPKENLIRKYDCKISKCNITGRYDHAFSKAFTIDLYDCELKKIRQKKDQLSPYIPNNFTQRIKLDDLLDFLR